MFVLDRCGEVQRGALRGSAVRCEDASLSRARVGWATLLAEI